MEKGPSPLFVAAEQGQKAMVQHLCNEVEHSSNTFNGVTPLMVALKEGHKDVIPILLPKAPPKPLEKDDEEKNWFHHAFSSRQPVEATEVLVNFLKETLGDTYSDVLHDFLTSEDLNDDAPLHILALQDLEKDDFDKIFDILKEAKVLECMKEKNSTKETPLHKAANNKNARFVEAVISLLSDDQLLLEKDENSNTPLHLETRQVRSEIPPLLKYVKNKRDQMKHLAMKNYFGESPFSGAVGAGDLEVVREMLRGLTKDEKVQIVNQNDFSGMAPLHLAAEFGHVDVFTFLLENSASITQPGPDEKTALDFAIDKEKREVVRAVIRGEYWEESFQIPSTSEKGELDTPFRKLIRGFPDLAEEFLDRCYKKEFQRKDQDLDDPNDEAFEEVIKMNYGFLEDTYKYSKVRSDGGKKEKASSINTKFKLKEKDASKEPNGYMVDVNNHPLMIMVRHQKVDLLQHPLCLAITMRKWSKYGRKFYFAQLAFYSVFLLAFSLYVLTSPSPIEFPDGNSCTTKTETNQTETNKTDEVKVNTEEWLTNDVFRGFVLFMNVLRVIMFFYNREYLPILDQLKEFSIKRPRLPVVFLSDALVYSLAIYVAIHNWNFIDGQRTAVRSCEQWPVSSIAITLAWLNLLLYMRLLNTIGQYVIIFKDVLITSFAISIIFIILVVAFGSGFHILLSDREEFEHPWDSMLKTMIMMSGEIDYGDIFFKGKAPEGWGEDMWDPGHEKVAFPIVTYTLFVLFFTIVCIVALNVVVGLTVDDIRNFLAQADLRKLKMRLKFILMMERNARKDLREKEDKKDSVITKQSSFELPGTNDLISKAKIWEKIEKKQEESRKKSEGEKEWKNMKDLIKGQTRKLKDVMYRPRKAQDHWRSLKTNLEGIERKNTSATLKRNKTKGELFTSQEMDNDGDEDFSKLLKNVETIMYDMKKLKSEVEGNKRMMTDLIQKHEN